MNLFEAKRILKNNGYELTKEYFPMNEGIMDAGKVLKKIGSLLKGWRSEIKQADKEDDEEKKEEIAKKAKQLKAEIEDKKLLHDKVSPKLKSIVMGGIVALMAMGAVSNAHAAATDNAHFDNGFKSSSLTSSGGNNHFDALDNAINAACEDPESCHVNIVSYGHDNGSSNDVQKITSGDGNGHDTFSWKLNKDKVKVLDNGRIMATIDVDTDGNGASDHTMRIAIDNDGNIEDGVIRNDTSKYFGSKPQVEKLSSSAINDLFPNIDKMASYLHHVASK